jgi:hypothetical protein
VCVANYCEAELACQPWCWTSVVAAGFGRQHAEDLGGFVSGSRLATALPRQMCAGRSTPPPFLVDHMS